MPGNKYTDEYYKNHEELDQSSMKKNRIKDLSRQVAAVKKTNNSHKNIENKDEFLKRRGATDKEIEAWRSLDMTRPIDIANAIYKSGRYQDTDAQNRHMRRHPNKYKDCGIFESVKFLYE